MKTLLVYILCASPLLRLGRTTAVLVPHTWRTEGMGNFAQVSKDETADATCDAESRSIVKHIDLQHRWVIEHFRDQEALQKLTSVPTQSAEFSSPDGRYKFKISLESTEGTQRKITLYSLTDSDSLTCKVSYAVVSGKDGSLYNLSSKVIHLNETKGDMELLKVPLPDNLEEYIDNDALIILCSVTIYEQAASLCDITTSAAKGSVPSPQSRATALRLLEDIRALIDSSKKLLQDKTSARMNVEDNQCILPVQRRVSVGRNNPAIDSLLEGMRQSICSMLHDLLVLR